MLELAHPWITPLIGIGTLLVWRWQRGRSPALRFPSAGTLIDLPRGRAPQVRPGGATLRLLVVVAAGLAAAGPRWPGSSTPPQRRAAALVLVIDVSESMRRRVAFPGEVAPVTQLEAARRAARQLVDGQPGDLTALVAFGEWPETACPLTADRRALLAALDRLAVRESDTFTNVGDAVATGLSRAAAAPPGLPRALLVISDGEQQVDLQAAANPLRPRQAGQLALNLGVPVHCVDVGQEPNVTMPADELANRRAGRANLEALARLSGGTFHAAGDGAGLVRAVTAVGTLERRPVAGLLTRKYADLTPWFTALALAGLVALWALERTRWRTVP